MLILTEIFNLSNKDYENVVITLMETESGLRKLLKMGRCCTEINLGL